MMITDIASILFVCVAANHMGLVSAIEDVVGFRLPIVNCVKCSTFWLTMLYGVGIGADMIRVLAMSFLCSWIAIWLELCMGCIDTLYYKVYEKIINGTANNEATPDTTEDSADNAMS